MLEILQHCNDEYVPKCQDPKVDGEDQDTPCKILHKVAFGGDHLTVKVLVPWLQLVIQTPLWKSSRD